MALGIIVRSPHTPYSICLRGTTAAGSRVLADSGCVVASFLSVLFHVPVVSPSGLSWFLCMCVYSSHGVLMLVCWILFVLVLFVLLVSSAAFQKTHQGGVLQMFPQHSLI